jgi:site-specific recombinase XerD
MNSLTNEEWIAEFKRYLERRFPGRSTAVHYESDMKCFLLHYKGPLLAVGRADIDAFVDEQRRQGLAAATVKRRAAALKNFFDFVADETGDSDRQRENPVSLKRHGGRVPQQLPRDLSDEEVERLLAVIHNKRDQALVMLMLYGGLRVEEVVNLTREGITAPAEATLPARLRVLGKGRKERIVYLKPEAYQVMDAYLQEHDVWPPNQPLFTNQKGHPLTIAGVQWLMRGYAQASGVVVTCHRLRHTCARWLAEGEMPLLSLARFLGHSSLSSTQRYIDGANPQVRRHYDQAMKPSQPLLANQPALLTGASQQPPPSPSTTPTVIRAEPTLFEAPDWLAAWPTWLQESCLAWINQRWFQWKPSRRQHHARVSLNHLRTFWRWQMAHRSLAGWHQLTAADIAAFIAAELGRGIAPSTVASVMDQVYALLNDLLDRQQLSTLPPRPVINLPDPLPRHLQPTELLSLESYLHQHAGDTDQLPWLTAALYYVLAHGGLRIGELLDLQVRDLDLTGGRLTIRQGKGRRDRLVYLTQTAIRALSAYLQTVPHAPDDLLFSYNQAPLTYHRAYLCLRQLGQAAGVPNLYPMRLRHTYATTLLNNGMTLDALRQLMGHNHLNTTLIYARLADTTVENQYQAAMANVTNR